MPELNNATQEPFSILHQFGEEKTVETGEFIFKEGDNDPHFYVVLSGEIEISIKTSEGWSKVIAVVKQNELLGEGVLSGKTLKPASARAINPVKLLCLSQDQFTALLEKEPRAATQLVLHVLGMTNHRLHRTNIKMLALFEISKNLSLHRDDLKAMGSALIQHSIGLTDSSNGALILKNPFTDTYSTIHTTTDALNENHEGVKQESASLSTTSSGHLMTIPLKQTGVILLSRSLDTKEFEDDDLRLMQLVAQQVTSTIKDTFRKAEEKARTVLHQKKIAL